MSYTGKGQTQSPASQNLSPSMAPAINWGGARGVATVMAGLGIYELQKNVDLAQKYHDANIQDYNFWNSTYQPKMQSALAEGMTRGFYREGGYLPYTGALDYRAAVGRAQSNSQVQTDKTWFINRRKLNKYNVGLGRRLDYKFSITRLNAELEGWNLGFRYEDNRKLRYDEERHAHQAEILNLGIGEGNAIRSGLATSVNALSGARSETSSMLASLSNGLSTAAGFNKQMRGVEQDRAANRTYARSQETQNQGVLSDVPNAGKVDQNMTGPQYG